MSILNKKQLLDKDKVNVIGSILVFLIVAKYYSNMLFIGTSIPVAKIFMALSGVFALILIVNDIKKYNIFHLLILGLLGIQFVITKNKSIIYAYILALALVNLDMKKIIKTYIITNIIFFVIYLTLNVFNIKPTEFVHDRNDFGFGNPNGAFISFFTIWVSYLYLKFDDLKKKDIGLLILFPIVVYSQTNTRTGFLTIAGAMILAFALEKIDVRKKTFKWFFTLIPGLLASLSLIVAYGFHNSDKLNRWLSHRPLYWYRYLVNKEYGLNLIGYNDNIRDIVFTPRLPLDSGYILTLYNSGIIVFLLIILLYSYAIYQLCKEGKKAEITLILCILAYAFAESIILDLGTNITFIFIAYALCKLGKKKQINDR